MNKRSSLLTTARLLLLLVAVFTIVSLSLLPNGALSQRTITTGYLGPNDVYFQQFKFPARMSGNTTITVQAAYNVEICIQEGVVLLGNLQSCNPGLYFLLDTNSPSEQKPEEIKTTATDNQNYHPVKANEEEEEEEDNLNFLQFERDMRAYTVYSPDPQLKTWTIKGFLRNSLYYLSAKFNVTSDQEVNSTITFSIKNSPGCATNQIGSPDGSCQNVTSIADAKSTPISLAANEPSSVFYLDVPERTCPLRITAKLEANGTVTKETTSVKLFLSRFSAPTTTKYDFTSSVTVPATGIVTLSLIAPQPIPGDWYAMFTNSNNQKIGVIGNWTVNYGRNCAVNGKVTDLTGNINLTHVIVNETGFMYYTLTGEELTFGVAVDNSDDDDDDDDDTQPLIPPPVTVSHFNFPGNDSYLIASKTKTMQTNYIWAASTSQDYQWKIAVWAQENQTYYVWAGVNCPNRCEGDDFSPSNSKPSSSDMHGTCLATEGVCVCDSRYEGLTCTKKDFSVVWIVLIVIAVVVVIGIAIAAWYIRNRRKRQRETLYLD